MPIEINELVVRAVVSESGKGGSGTAEGAGSVSPDSASTVQACVAEVLRILRQRQER